MRSFELEFALPHHYKVGSIVIKEKPEDFIVEEITKEGEILRVGKKINKKGEGGKYTWFVLQKKNWGTDIVIKEMAKRLHVSHKRFNFTGNKDKRAITTQLVSVWNVEEDALLSLNIPDVSILGSWRMKDKVHMGQLLGNAFTVKGKSSLPSEKVFDYFKENMSFPNYYGIQRFGNVRQITHIIGYYMIKGDFETAVRLFLTSTHGERNKDAIEARERLGEEWDFGKALDYFPKFLKHERILLSHLKRHPRDYVNAFRKLPLQTRLIFVHAFQSFLFNKMLSERIKEGVLEREEGEFYCSKDFFGFPSIEKRGDDFLVGKVIGYETELNDREKELLERYDVEKEDFRVKKMPEVGSKGTYRVLVAPFKSFSFSFSEGISKLSFYLPRGSYATVFLSMFFKVKEFFNM